MDCAAYFTRRALIVLVFTWSALAQTPELAGNWQGTLNGGAARLRIGLHVTKTTAGEYTSTLDSIDQGATGIPVAVIKLTGRALHFELPGLRAFFDGTLSADGTQIAGNFTQGVTLPLLLRRVEQVDTLRRPQTPQPPFPYDVEEVYYQNVQGKLAGTLTKPRGAGPFPAVLLITGSGPQDRDESMAGHKPFLVLADYLTRRGMAVLRVDDRGMGGSTGKSSEQTIDQAANDVASGVEFLKTRKEVDSRRVGLLGHSAGALAAMSVASRDASDVAFVVLLASPGVRGEEIVRSQNTRVLRSMGVPETVVERNARELDAMLGILKSEPDPKAAAEKMRAGIARIREPLSDVERKQGEQPLEAQIAQVTSAEFRGFLTFEPASVLKKVKAPVLAMNGSRDIQVDPQQNLSPIAAALASGGNHDFTVMQLPGLNHLFARCAACTVAEYSAIEETMSPTALDAISAWIMRHVL